MAYNRPALAREAERRLDKSPKKTAKEVAAYLVSAGKTGDLNSIIRDILTIRADEKGVLELTAVTAHPLGASERADIKRTVQKTHKSAKKIIINEQIDPSAIAGVRLEFPHESLDLTVEGQLHRLRTLTS